MSATVFGQLFLVLMMIGTSTIIASNQDADKEAESFIRTGSIGKPDKPTPVKVDELSKLVQENFPYRPLRECMGHEFIFLPQSKRLRELAWMAWHREGETDPTKFPGYEELAGKRCILEESTKDLAVVRLAKTGLKYRLEHPALDAESEPSVLELASLRDLRQARTLFVGMTLFYKGIDASSKLYIYDADKDELGEIVVKRYSPVKVTEVVAGDWRPVRFVLETDDKRQAFIDVVLSSRVNDPLSAFLPMELFSKENPRTVHKWADDIWLAIENCVVIPGMTKNQALMAWGKPHSINSTIHESARREQWVYTNKSILYFDGDKLSTIQN